MLAGDAFRVELHALDRQGAMAQAHDGAILQPGGDLEAIGQAFALDHQRVIASGEEGRGQAAEHAFAFVIHLAHLAMHDLVDS